METQIITRITPHEPASWQQSLANVVTDPFELLKALDLPLDLLPGVKQAARLFGLKVTHSYLKRIRKADPQDPLLLQVLPHLAETQPQPKNFSHDPVGDHDATQVPGVIHKYHGRVLLITTAACAIHCRYCFRRNFPYADSHAGRNQWQTALDYIANDESIEEVILSGGDPLVLADHKLAELCQKLSDIPHLKRLRLHTRLPIVLPERINDSFLNWISGSQLKIVLVVHCNHPNEINDEVATALNKLSDAGIPTFNQAVLLKHINDSVDILARLSKELFAASVMPYYLHQLDPVTGAAHFAVSVKKAQDLYAQLTALLPGYLVPRLVIEQAGMPAKTLLTP